MIDSGGFTELTDSPTGDWRTSAKQYVPLARRYVQEIGNVEFIAAQDMMCEPSMLEKTGLSVRTHQAMTIANYLELLDQAPEVPWLPVLQGWTPDDYFRHVDMYGAFGVDLTTLPLVGLGTVCSRQTFTEARYIVRRLHAAGMRLHGFGIKTAALSQLCSGLRSSDSMAASQNARRESANERRHGFRRVPCPVGKTHSCSGCLPFALAWRERVLAKLERRTPLFEWVA